MTNEEAIKCLRCTFYNMESCQKEECNEHEAIQMAIEALEKQEPKKPIQYDTRWNGETLYKCPECGGILGTKAFNIMQRQIGCPRCLAAIDWSEEE